MSTGCFDYLQLPTLNKRHDNPLPLAGKGSGGVQGRTRLSRAGSMPVGQMSNLFLLRVATTGSVVGEPAS